MCRVVHTLIQPFTAQIRQLFPIFPNQTGTGVHLPLLSLQAIGTANDKVGDDHGAEKGATRMKKLPDGGRRPSWWSSSHGPFQEFFTVEATELIRHGGPTLI